MQRSITVVHFNQRGGPGLNIRVPLDIANRLGLRAWQTVDHDTLLRIQAERKREREKQK